MANDDADDDAALVRATLGGRAQAFGLLYDRYAPLVRAICFDATGDLSGAQDLSQEAFLRAFRKLRDLKKLEQFAPWLIGIAKHVCREWRRGVGRRRRQVARVAALADVRCDTTDCETASGGRDADEDLRELREAIAALPAREREALHLFYLQEQPADVAANMLGLSRSGFYRALERAKARVQRILGLRRSRGVTP